MKILYVITALGVGGAEIVTINIANQIVSRGYGVTILHLREMNNLKSYIDPRVQTVTLSMTKSPVSFIKALFRASKFIKRWKPDIVHGQMFHANLFCRILRVFLRFPVLITTEHNKYIGGRLRMVLYRITDFLTDLNTNVSKEATELFVKCKSFSENKTMSIYNGIDLEKFFHYESKATSIREKYGINEEDFVFINVGRLTEAKNHKGLIDVFTLLVEKYKNMKLLIVGTGELENELQNYIRVKGGEEFVSLAGRHFNVVDFYNASDCFVLSSTWEGFGVVLVEAMACELPVVTTDAGGCAEVVDDPQFVVPVGDLNILYQKMEQIYLMKPQTRMVLGSVNREKSRRFDLHSICDQWVTVYTKFIKAYHHFYISIG